jgi:hypothetical protein
MADCHESVNGLVREMRDHGSGRKILNMVRMIRVLTAGLLCALLMGIGETARAAGTRVGVAPTITAVHFSRLGQNMHIEVDGADFGTSPWGVPGTSGTLSFTDVSHGNWSAGLDGRIPLQYTQWSDVRIVVDGFASVYGWTTLQYGGQYQVSPGDKVAILVKNYQSGLSTRWTGTLRAEAPPALDPGGPTPIIVAMHFSNIGKNLRIEVDGAGYAAYPTNYPALPVTGCDNDFLFTDVSQGGWRAGHGGCTLALHYTSWTDTRIVVDGFGAQYGGVNTQGGGGQYQVSPGDKVVIQIRNVTSGEFTVWTGTLQAGAAPTPKPGTGQVVPLSPLGDAHITPNTAVRFAWKPFAGAQGYLLHIWIVRQTGSVALTATTAATLSTLVFGQASYSWNDRGFLAGTYAYALLPLDANGNALATWSPASQFTLDAR